MSDDTMIPAALKRTAVQAIAKFDAAYFEEGGIDSLERQLAEKREGIAQHIFKLAAQARRAEKNLADAASLFKAACTYAEERYKAEHEVSNVGDRIPAWTQFKSRILRAMKNGLDPAKFNSERAMRDALREQLREGREPSKRPEERPPDGEPPEPQEEPEQIQDFLAQTGVHTTLQVVLSRIVLEAEYIRPAKRKEAEKILSDAARALSKLVDKRRIASDATMAALQAAA